MWMFNLTALHWKFAQLWATECRGSCTHWEGKTESGSGFSADKKQREDLLNTGAIKIHFSLLLNLRTRKTWPIEAPRQCAFSFPARPWNVLFTAHKCQTLLLCRCCLVTSRGWRHCTCCCLNTPQSTHWGCHNQGHNQGARRTSVTSPLVAK